MVPKEIDAFIEPMIAMASSQFPRSCNSCKRLYPDFRRFILETKPIGTPTVALEMPVDPFGMISWSNCACGNTMILMCQDVSHAMHDRFAQTLKAVSQESGRPVDELLKDIREEVRRRASDNA